MISDNCNSTLKLRQLENPFVKTFNYKIFSVFDSSSIEYMISSI